MLKPSHLAFTIICVSGQEIENLPRDGDIFTIQKTTQGKKSARLHEGFTKVQNWMRGHGLSSGPPSSTKNVDDARTANMSRGSPQ